MLDLSNLEQIKMGGTSKGNQIKFYHNGYWIKLDNQYCSEGLAEEFVSLFCDCIYDLSHVVYHTERYLYNDNEYTGCYSYNMYDDLSVSFVSMRKLFHTWGVPINTFFLKDAKTNIVNVANIVEQYTGLNVYNYFRQLVLLDALILNEDRHYMNMGLFVKANQFMLAPVFDNGSSLFCVNWIYRKSKSLEENINSAKSVARPFSKFYDNQVNAILELGGQPLKIDKNKLTYLLNHYHNELYSDEMNQRIKDVLKLRLDYYVGRAFVYV